MSDPRITQHELHLRKRVDLLLRGRAKHRKSLTRTVQDLKGCNLPAYVFGGTLRDLMLCRGALVLRDLDIVVESINNPHFDHLLSKHRAVKNRFGGYHVNVEGWKFDIWGLEDTWAFRQDYVKNVSFENLAKTSFLNIEAIVVRLDTERFIARDLYSHGFFEAFLERKLEINLEENPYPVNCVMRSLALAARFNFAIGARLARYIDEHSKHTTPEELAELFWRHYKRTSYGPSEFSCWLKSVKEQTRSRTERVQIAKRATQPELWNASALPSGIKPNADVEYDRRSSKWKLANLWAG